MEPRFLAYAAQSAPRYTSYPTAPQFHREVDASLFKAWLGALAPDAPLSLYIHVPYCRDICWYCGCHTFAVRREETIERYVETLMREIELAASAASAERVACIHWGGGTPNVLSPALFEKLFKHLAFWFDLGDLAEHAIELDPRHVTRELAGLYACLGVTRASLGIQDVNATVQASIGRIQTRAKIAEAVRLLRAAGIRGLGMDLMYGLPNQTIEDVRRSARAVAAMAPDRVAVFGYAHVPWFKTRQRLIDETALPDPRLRMEQRGVAHGEFIARGYEPVGLDHYALPSDQLAAAARAGALRRNFHGYVHEPRMALIGLGASAISTLPQGYAQNASEIGAWSRAVCAGHLATVRGRALTEDDRRRGALIESLLCQFEADLSRFGGRAAFTRELEALAPLIEDGLARMEGDKVVIPPEARPLARVVAERFDAYRGLEGARHSNVI